MICKDCNIEFTDAAKFCPRCGKTVKQTQQKQSRKLPKVLSCCFFIALLVMLIIPVSIIVSNNRKFNSRLENRTEINDLDLSQYKDHGELSCGRIWVIKEDSDWNEDVEEKFAYLDTDGNIVSEWFSLNKYRFPRDFVNGYVIVIEEETFERIYDYSNCAIYDINFNQIASLNCRYPRSSGPYITDFDYQGYAYALGYDHSIKDDALYWIDQDGVHIFEEGRYANTIMVDEYVLRYFKMSNNYFVAACGSSDPDYLYTHIACVWNKKGKLVLDIEEVLHNYADDFAVTSAEVLENNRVRVYFYGTNKKEYVCTMDFKGNFVESPTEA